VTAAAGLQPRALAMNTMAARGDASRRVFFRYAITNLLILALPLLAPLSAACEGGSYPLLRDVLLAAIARHLGDGEVVAPDSFDDVAVIRCPRPPVDHRTQAAAFVEAVRGSLDAGFRGNFFFGIGRPTDDPFLPTISHQEAVTVVSALAAEGREAFAFYEDLPRAAAAYHYPLDDEENGVRAVRSGNADLLDSLLASIQEELRRSCSRPDLGLTVLADAFGISENYLSSFSKEQTGEGLSAAIHRIRFAEAARRLAGTGETIDAIALA
jgi:AraC-like DNA-binding protein